MTKKELSSSGIWIPLMEYAIKNDVSLSTLRRHIKAKKVIYRTEGGRYLLLDQQQVSGARPIGHLESEISDLKLSLMKAQEEIAELKTLIALYEEKISQTRLDS